MIDFRPDGHLANPFSPPFNPQFL